VLVNNTCGPHVGTFDNFGDKDWQAVFELVLLSLIRALRGSVHLMRQRGGYIVNIASSSIKQPIENLILSNTFRAGILGFAKSLSVELAPDGILINTLGPGRTSTARSQSIGERNAEAARVPVEEVRGRVEFQTPLARYRAPEELARVAAFVASPANN
jgi:3-oxoacyl-[acyl-carrier protein] reductase